MRPSERPSGAVWRVMDAWASRQQKADAFNRRPAQLDMAKAFGVSKSLITAWKMMDSRIQVQDMVTIASRTDITYGELSVALAEDEPTIARNQARKKQDEQDAALADLMRKGEKDMRDEGRA